MESRQLGRSGLKAPALSLGNWRLKRPTASSVIIGARDEAQLKDGLGAVGWNLTRRRWPNSTPRVR